jgi:tRNA(Phe) wybutosine-synthesizing methylase Tyw3
MTGREIMINFIRDILRPKTLEEILSKEMREAYLSKLEAEKALEYATSVVEYNRSRMRRLEERIQALNKESASDRPDQH